jgi:hypothetical protein
MLWRLCTRDPIRETQLLIDECRNELSRLHRQIGELNKTIATSLDLINEAAYLNDGDAADTPTISQPTLTLLTSYRQTLLARSKDTRSFANSVKDPAAKRLLLQLADDYEEKAQKLARTA